MALIPSFLEKGIIALTWIMCPPLDGVGVWHIAHSWLLPMNHVNGAGKGSTHKKDVGLTIQVMSTFDYLVLLRGRIFLPSVFNRYR